MTPTMTPVDKRNFYLSLSIIEGQKIASTAGFFAPSQEVQESEIMDNIHKWLILTALGIFENVKDCASLMMEVVKLDNGLSDFELQSTENALISFGMGLVAHLVDTELLTLASDFEEVEMNTQAAKEFIDMLQGRKEED